MPVLGVYQRLGMGGKVEGCTAGIKFPFLNGKEQSWEELHYYVSTLGLLICVLKHSYYG